MDISTCNSYTALLSLGAILLLAGCGTEPGPQSIEYAHTKSPDGSIEAYVYEYNMEAGELTQIMLMFPGGCGSGSASAYRSGLGLKLQWIDDENLEVIHPPGIEFKHNASGDVLQCFERKVHVRLISRAQ